MGKKVPKRYYWLKLKEDFFEDDTIRFLREQPNGNEYCICYLILCCKALRTNGKLVRIIGNTIIPYDIKALALLTGCLEDTVKGMLGLLQQVGVIEVNDSGEIFLQQLDEMVGSESQWAEYARKRRLLDKDESKLIEADIQKMEEFSKNVKNTTPNVVKNTISSENPPGEKDENWILSNECPTYKDKDKDKDKELDKELELEKEKEIVSKEIRQKLKKQNTEDKNQVEDKTQLNEISQDVFKEEYIDKVSLEVDVKPTPQVSATPLPSKKVRVLDENGKVKGGHPYTERAYELWAEIMGQPCKRDQWNSRAGWNMMRAKNKGEDWLREMLIFARECKKDPKADYRASHVSNLADLQKNQDAVLDWGRRFWLKRNTLSGKELDFLRRNS